MEDLIRNGFIAGMLDITTHEIADEMLGGVLSAGPDRLTAAGDMGIPQVVAPGGLDLINFGPKHTVPERLLKETDQPGRGLYEHNPTVTCIGVSMDEAYRIGEHMAEKLNRARPQCSVRAHAGMGRLRSRDPRHKTGLVRTRTRTGVGPR